ncbi:hypothetical protein EGH24_13900 [Halonotius terrestris]|uniref:Uncharacterized protein n=1 Tax=Halonotius terrestris TaxID=2487750 RepID=A0A8J8P5J2_9EURY|nr:hypothetical protein [Halonotius terrestris]TQQ78611.1 hypothetical protein EGH24_13900 [Halonotius terrestris]
MENSGFYGTEIAECPSCEHLVAGHVHGDSAAGVYSWACPACDYSCEPTDLDDSVSVSELLEQDVLEEVV